MARYTDDNTEIFMDTGNCKEWITLYYKNKDMDCIKGLRFDRRMAYALMNEIDARLFDGDEDDIKLSEVLKEGKGIFDEDE